VDEAYRDFFKVVLPFLHARSTDVHVATCLPFIKDLIQAETEPVDERVVQIAFILHDSGWSQMSELEIAESLGVTGLSLSGQAIQPKPGMPSLANRWRRKFWKRIPSSLR